MRAGAWPLVAVLGLVLAAVTVLAVTGHERLVWAAGHVLGVAVLVLACGIAAGMVLTSAVMAIVIWRSAK